MNRFSKRVNAARKRLRSDIVVVRDPSADDVGEAARAIREAVHACKMNYEILGNVDPHLHCHLIPRQTNEPRPKAPAWLHPDPEADLSPEAADVIKQRIRALLLAAHARRQDTKAGGGS